jgi:hypothetical protein
MGFFNFIETSFFVSLGITFILILLMVYHFKERLSGLEKKGDTMFEIINNIVREISNLKNTVIMQSQQQVLNEQSFIQPNQHMITETYSNTPLYNNTYVNKNMEEDEYSDSEESTDSEDSDDSDDSSDSGNESIDIEREGIIEDEHMNVPFDATILTDQVVDFSSDSVKIININMGMEEYHKPASNDVGESECNIQVHSKEHSNINKEEDVSMNEESEDDKEDNISNDEGSDKDASMNDEVVQSPSNKINAPIYVSKLEDDSGEFDAPHKEEKKESYKDLTIQQLKAIVISKGITTSVSKLKKNELIQLLENN